MYSTIVKQSEYTDGTPCWVAWHPELDYQNGEVRIRRCLGQGATIREAQADLEELTALFIEELRADGLPVPTPRHTTLTILGSMDANRHMGATEQPAPTE